MIVPSRSTKTAGDSASFMFVVLSEPSNEFISRDGCRAELADDAAAMIGDLRRFNRSGFTDEPKGEERNSSIACARDIKNLACLGWDVVRRFILLKQHHPVFAECD